MVGTGEAGGGGRLSDSLVPLQHLGRAVLDSATESGQQLSARHERRRAEVDQLDVERRVDDDVLVLHVPVQDLQRVQVVQS